MKYLKQTILILGFLFFCFSQTNSQTTSVQEKKSSSLKGDKEEIQNLIRQLLNWSDSKSSIDIDLLPSITNGKDSIYIGFDLDKHKKNLGKLRQTNFFATEFINNYNNIILNFDKRLKNGIDEQWLVGQLPPFMFANDGNPWCMCQDVPYDKPNPWDNVKIKIVNLSNYKGEVVWKWGKLEQNSYSGWKDFSYKVRVIKENSKWKVAYLQGFDFKESTK